MTRFATASPTQPPPTTEGDSSFLGMDMADDRGAIRPGYYYYAENYRVAADRQQVLSVRGGTITPTFANVDPFGTILGSGRYSNPNKVEVILVATPSDVRVIRDGSYPDRVPLPPGVTLQAPIEFSQQFHAVLLHRGPGFRTLVWDGVSPAGFVEVEKSVPENTARDVLPNVDWSTDMADRTVFPLSHDELGTTDIGDYSMYDPDFGVWRVNVGTADPIVGVYRYARNNLIVGKRKSFDVLANFIGDLSAAGMEALSDTVGILARKSWQMVGADGLFLFETGFYRISEVIQDKLEAGEVPASNSITPLIKRINFKHADKAVSALLGIYYFCAVPVDDSTVNNAVFVYNTASREWEALDTWNPAAGMQIDNLIVTDYLGKQHVFAVNHAANSVHVLYVEGAKSDTTAGGEFAIPDQWKSRGYATLGWNAATRRDFKNSEFALSTWDPSVTIDEVTEGAGDVRRLTTTPYTRDRRKYKTFSKADYDTTNVNDDHGAVGREDYSVELDDDAGGINLDDAGINFDQSQEEPLRFALMARGRWTAFDLYNTQGTCDILGCLLKSSGTQREIRKVAKS